MYIVYLIWFLAAYDQLCATDNHTLAVVKMSESYDNLAKALSPLLDEIKVLMGTGALEVGGKTYELEFFLGGDLKVGNATPFCFGSCIILL